MYPDAQVNYAVYQAMLGLTQVGAEALQHDQLCACSRGVVVQAVAQQASSWLHPASCRPALPM